MLHKFNKDEEKTRNKLVRFNVERIKKMQINIKDNEQSIGDKQGHE